MRPRPRPTNAPRFCTGWCAMLRLDGLLVCGCMLAFGCSDAPTGPVCVANLSTNCNELYPPTFQQLYDNVLHPTCASGSGTCHTGDAAKGGLLFEDPTTSYRLLLGMIDGRARVIPG